MRWTPLILLAACASEPAPDDIVGPFTGPVHRYVVDGFVIPTTGTQARELGGDLNGDKTADNQLGQIFGFLANDDNLTTHADDMIASGAIASIIEIQADDLVNDPTVGVRYYGQAGDPVIEIGGAIVDGVFHSNRTYKTHVPGEATVRIPVFADADPSVVLVDGVEMDFGPEGDGLYVRIRGGVDPIVASAETARGVIQMIEANPQGHPYATRLFDTNVDGVVTDDEVTKSSLIEALLAPDVRLRIDGDYVERLSFGFGVHAIPCESGNCALGTPADTCFDRVLDGDETDIDCGGSCMACPGDAVCTAADDCQSQSCAGTCAAPSCDDGVHNGYESDVDCGWNCGGCAVGYRCETDSDCTSGRCNGNGVCW